MYDLFLKLTREELSSIKLAQLDPVRLREYRSFIETTLNSLIKDIEAFDYFRSILENVVKDLELWVRFRLVKSTLNPESVNEAYDKEYVNIVGKIIDVYKWVFSGLFVSYRDLMFVKIGDNAVVRGKTLRKNDHVFLNPKDYLGFFVSGKITPIPRLIAFSLKLM